MDNSFYINDVRIDPKINTVTRNGTQVKIEPKIMHVLMCLVEAKGEVVSKQHLFETVWAETVVVEMVLTRAISELRRVFGDKPSDPKFIDTISKSGYRLIAEVRSRKPENRRKKALRMSVPAIVTLVLIIVLFGFLQSDPAPTVVSKPFTANKGWEYHPSISNGGEWVAYVSSEVNSKFSDIYIKSTSQDSSLKLTTSDKYYLKPVWSPDDKQLAAFGSKNGIGGIHFFSVADRSLLKVVQINTTYVGLAWSLDGGEISYMAYDTSNSRHCIYKYSLKDSSSTLQVTPSLNTWGDSHPRYSPDGKSLAFIRTVSEGNQDIYNLELSTSVVKRVTQINRNIRGFTWEDESTLLISSDLDGGDNLWKLNVISNDNPITMERVVKIPYGESIQNPTVHEGLIIGEKWTKDIDLILSNLDGKLVKDSMALTSTQWELHPDISRDGKEIVFSTNRSGNYEIWKYKAEDQSLHQLTDFRSGFSGKPRWSPDGKLIAFESNSTGSHQIYLIDADGQQLRQITDGEGDYINPSWSGDGSFIYCSSNLEGDWNIWAQSISNGRLKKIHSSGGYFLQEAYGFGRAFITRLHFDGIWEIKMDGTEEKIIEDLNSADWGSWSISRNGIYYFNRKTLSISFYDFATKESSQVIQLEKKIPIYDPAFTIWEEGGIILYGQLKNYSGDLVAIRNY